MGILSWHSHFTECLSYSLAWGDLVVLDMQNDIIGH